MALIDMNGGMSLRKAGLVFRLLAHKGRKGRMTQQKKYGRDEEKE